MKINNYSMANQFRNNFLMKNSINNNENKNGLFNNNNMNKIPKNAGIFGNSEAQDKYEIDKITKKIARGESLTPEERMKLEKIDPELIRKAEMANRRRVEIKSRLKNAGSKGEADTILLQARAEVVSAMDAKDTTYGELLSEAVKKVEEEYYNGHLDDDEAGKILDIKL